MEGVESEDRKGRTFRTWYETTVQGFDMVYDGAGYEITRWGGKEDEQQTDSV